MCGPQGCGESDPTPPILVCSACGKEMILTPTGINCFNRGERVYCSTPGCHGWVVRNPILQSAPSVRGIGMKLTYEELEIAYNWGKNGPEIEEGMPEYVLLQRIGKFLDENHLVNPEPSAPKVDTSRVARLETAVANLATTQMNQGDVIKEIEQRLDGLTARLDGMGGE